jgi:guanidinoacetate N-methyltransferase
MKSLVRSDITEAGLQKTFEERSQIGFSDDVNTWRDSEAIFDEHTLRIEDHPVMEDWEDGYMKMLADVASHKGGKVLEVGYGMGISARYVQVHPIDTHVIIEANNGVYEKLLEFQSSARANVVPLLGFWQEIISDLEDESFDGILFDTYPLTKEEIHGNHFPFFHEAFRLLKPGGVFTYYSDEPTTISDFHRERLQAAGFTNIDLSICEVTPPEDCQYWIHNTIVVPIIIK